MPLTTAEVESLRFHLGYGNVGLGGYPYIESGFFETFYNVIAPNLSEGQNTTATTAITAKTVTTVTPVSMTGITVNERLFVDTGDEAEEVIVKAITLTTFTAAFLKTHAASGYPIATFSGIARARFLLWKCDKAFEKWTGTSAGGLKKVDEIEWFDPNAQSRSRRYQYMETAKALSSLCRVQLGWPSRGSSMMETY